MTAKQTMIHANNRERVIFQFSPPLSAIVLVMFSVSRYQKYVVAELFSHSGSTTAQAKKAQVHDTITVRSVNERSSTFNTASVCQ